LQVARLHPLSGQKLQVRIAGNRQSVDQIGHVGQPRTIDSPGRHASPEIGSAGQGTGPGDHPGPVAQSSGPALVSRHQVRQGKPAGLPPGQRDRGEVPPCSLHPHYTAQVQGAGPGCFPVRGRQKGRYRTPHQEGGSVLWVQPQNMRLDPAGRTVGGHDIQPPAGILLDPYRPAEKGLGHQGRAAIRRFVDVRQRRGCHENRVRSALVSPGALVPPNHAGQGRAQAAKG